MFMRFFPSILNTFSSILFSRSARKGVAALITVLSLGGLIFLIALSATLISYWANQNSKSIKDATKAFYASQSGLNDALLKLERNKSFSSTNGFNLSLYNTNDVFVTVSNSNGQATIIATSTIGIANKKIQAVVNVDTTTGLVSPTSTVESGI